VFVGRLSHQHQITRLASEANPLSTFLRAFCHEIDAAVDALRLSSVNFDRRPLFVQFDLI
jgi:hypothetical protein